MSVTSNSAATFERICIRHRPKLLSFARRLCHDQDEAEDLAQEAFVRAFRAFSNFQDEKPVENWLMRILQNVFFDARRRNVRRPQLVSGSALARTQALELAPDPRPNVEEALPIHEEANRIRICIDSLRSDYAELLRMAYIEEKPYSEIASKLGIQRTVVRSRLHRARLKMRSEFEREAA